MRHNCLNCGRFTPQVPEGWEICQYPECDEFQYQDYKTYEYRILVHDCNTGTTLEMLIKRKKL